MATSTLIQFLGDGITSPTGAGADTMNRRQVETFISGAAIVAGDVVMLDTTKTGADRALYIKQASAVATGNPLAIGVALDAAAAAGEQVRVVVAGYVAGVNCSAAGATNLDMRYSISSGNGSLGGGNSKPSSCSICALYWNAKCS